MEWICDYEFIKHLISIEEHLDLHNKRMGAIDEQEKAAIEAAISATMDSLLSKQPKSFPEVYSRSVIKIVSGMYSAGISERQVIYLLECILDTYPQYPIGLNISEFENGETHKQFIENGNTDGIPESVSTLAYIMISLHDALVAEELENITQ